MLLEGANRLVKFGIEKFEGHVPPGIEIVLGAIQQAQCGQRCPDLGHSSAAVTTAQRVAVFAARTRHTKGPPGLTDKLRCRQQLTVLSQTLRKFGKTPGYARGVVRRIK
ncbi:hypothetical protein MUNTM_38100 [Mycobacterium sp. MUNTM1]